MSTDRLSHLTGRPARVGVTVTLSAVLLLTGCTGSGADEAGRTAASFEQLTVAAPAQACDLLSGHTRQALEKSAKKACADALPDEDLPTASTVQSVQVFGHDTEVLVDGNVVFLARLQRAGR